MNRTRRFLPLVALAWASLAWGTAPARGDEPVTLEQATADLILLEKQLDKGRSGNEDILGSLDAVGKAYHNLKAPEAPAADAPQDVKDAYQAALDKHGREVAAWRKKVGDAYLKALTLVRFNAGDTRNNVREDVNIKAAMLLGETKDASLAGDIMKAIETKFAKFDHTISTALWDNAFASLGKLNDPSSFEWITKSYTHGKSSPPKVVDELVAAHKSIPLYHFPAIKGKHRLALVKEMIKTYSGIESQAEQSSTDPKKQSAKVFWDRIKTDVIKALQYLAKEPTNAQGEALSKMQDFQDWFRDHDKDKKEPWLDPKEGEDAGANGKNP